MKTCSACGVILTDENARRVKSGRQAGQFQSGCKVCRRKANQKWMHENRDRVLAYERKSLYGVSLEFLKQLRQLQGNCCAICEREFKKTPSVDHCHKTGKVRGLLCANCNSGIGLLGDSTYRLRAALRYLETAELDKTPSDALPC